MSFPKIAPTTEIAYLPLQPSKAVDLRDATTQARHAFRYNLDVLLRQKGFQKGYWGVPIENPSLLIMFIDWNSIADHNVFNTSEDHKLFLDKWMTILGGRPALYHAQFVPQPPATLHSAIDSAVSAINTLYFPISYSQTDQKHVDVGLRELISVLEKHAEGFSGGVSGWVEEEAIIPGSDKKSKSYVVQLGWTSVVAHMQFRETDVFKNNSHLLSGAKDLISSSLVHVAFIEIQKAVA